eukprot:1050131-Amphidinium_carterae.1
MQAEKPDETESAPNPAPPVPLLKQKRWNLPDYVHELNGQLSESGNEVTVFQSQLLFQQKLAPTSNFVSALNEQAKEISLLSEDCSITVATYS